MKKTIIIGATTNPSRYANLAAHRLVSFGHNLINIGIIEGEVADVPIEKAGSIYSGVDTITLYIGPEKQTQYYDYILKTKTKRVIFNPGTENKELEQLVRDNGIEAVEACTLVLLSTGQY